MKVPSLSWIDPAELSESLRRAGAGVGDPVGGWSQTRPKQPETIAKAPADPEPRPSSHRPERDSIEGRLKELVTWVATQIRADQVFVANADGLVLYEMKTNPDLVAVSTMFTNVLNSLPKSLEGTPGSLIMELKDGSFLQLLQAETLLGRTTLGFVIKKTVPPEAIDILRDGMLDALGRKESDIQREIRKDVTGSNIDNSGAFHK